MSADELEAAATQQRDYERGGEVAVFGPEGARRYNALQRTANTPGSPRADEASRQIAEMERGLTPAQERRLFGMGEKGYNAQDLAGIARAARDYDPSAVVDLPDSHLVNTVGRELLERRPHEDPVSAVRLHGALRELGRRGHPQTVIEQAVAGRARQQGVAPEDAAALLRSTLERLRDAAAPAAEEVAPEASGRPPAPGGDAPAAPLQLVGDASRPPAGPALPEPLPAAEPTPLHRIGRAVTLRTDAENLSPEGQFEVVDLHDPIVSHDHQDFAENPAYPQELQHRERERTAVAQAVIERTNRLDPERLGENPMASDGAPVVGPDNVVEVGNGRMMSLRRAADAGDERWVAYHRWLRDNAPRFGLSPEAFRDVENPILVRRRTGELDPGDRVAFSQAANIPTVETLGASEQARVDAQRLHPEHLGTLEVPDSGDLLAPGNRRFMERFISEVVPPSQRSAMFDREGVLSQEAARRARAAVFARAYGEGSGLVERLTESTTDDAKNVTAALVRAAPRFARLRADIDTGQAHPNVDLSPEISRAAGTLIDLRNRGVTVEQELSQGALLPRDPVEVRLLELIAQNRRSARKIGDVLTEYANLADDEPPPTQGAFFATAPPDKGALLDRAAARVNGGGLFESAAVKAQKEQGENGKQQAAYLEADRRLGAQIDAAEASGDYAEAQRLVTERQMLREGYPPVSGGGFLPEAVDKVREAFGFKEDSRLTKANLSDRSRLLGYLQTQGMYFRKHPGFRRLVAVLQRGFDQGRALAIRWLDSPETGFRPAMRALDRGERKLVEQALVDGDREATEYDADQLAARGLSPRAQQAYTRTRGLLNAMVPDFVNPLRDELGMQPVPTLAGYLPHRWFGFYDVYVNDVRQVFPTGSSFETEQQAFEAARQILAGTEDPNVRVRVEPRYREFVSHLGDAQDAAALHRILGPIERSGVADYETLRRAFYENRDPAGFSRHLTHREGALGYETARVSEVVERYLSEAARWIPLRRARGTVDTLLESVDARKSPNLHDAFQHLMGRVYGERGATETALDDLIRNAPVIGQWINPSRPTMRAVRSLKDLGFHLKLGLMNWAFYPVHASHFLVNNAPILGPEFALKGVREYWHPSAESAGVLARAESAGMLRPQFFEAGNWNKGYEWLRNAQGAREIGRVAWNAVSHLSGFFGQAAERQSRGYMILGSYYRAKAAGTAPDRLFSFVSDFTRNHIAEANSEILFDVARRANDLVNFRYDPASRPAMFTGPVGELLGQFKTYEVGFLELFKRHVDLARRGEGASPLMAQMGVLGAIAGLTGFTGFSLIDKFWQKLHPQGRSPMEVALDEIPKAAQALGATRGQAEAATQVALRGLPTLVGVDASRRLGMDITDRLDQAPDFLQELEGPAIGTLTDLFTLLWSGDYDMALRRIASGPGRLYSLVRAVKDGQEREASTRQRLRYTPEPRDILARMLGFQPLRATELGDVARVSARKRDQYRTARASLIDRAVTALNAGNSADMMAVVEEAQQQGIPLTMDDINREQRAKETPRLERLYKQTPKALRGDFMERAGDLMQRERARQLLQGR